MPVEFPMVEMKIIGGLVMCRCPFSDPFKPHSLCQTCITHTHSELAARELECYDISLKLNDQVIKEIVKAREEQLEEER